jgi:hypothetical protein
MRQLFFIGLAFFLFACNGDKKNALALLEQAQLQYENAEYTSAKTLIDSIKSLYPKEFEVLKDGLQLSRLIEIKELERIILLCDSLFPIRESEVEILKKDFIYEKDPEYDEVGKYFEKTQKIENKLQRSYIRSSLTELGEFQLASVFYGSKPIQHAGLKVSAPDGTYTETALIPYDGGMNYTFTDLGMTTEVVAYPNGKDGGITRFIYDNKDVLLKAEYLGGKKFTLTISQSDKNALVKTLDFSVVLAEIEKMKKEKEIAIKRIAYLRGKLNN